MIKKGFTLAEVLITLGVIGVVSALTLPSLMTDTSTAQIGPKLAKAVSAFEQANEAMLNNLGADSITESAIMGANNSETFSAYAGELSKYLKITNTAVNDGNPGYITTKDGISIAIPAFIKPSNTTDPAYKQLITDITDVKKLVMIDINGEDVKPNTAGTDRFYFTLWNDGSLRPKGAYFWNGTGAQTWKTDCPLAEEGVVKDYSYCAGHIFENNLKVLYR